MACTENPASEELADFIYRYDPSTFPAMREMENLCYTFVNGDYIIVHRPLREVLPLSLLREGYDPIPNLYALLDSSALESAGIYRTFDQPRLANRGNRALIGIVDTGIDYQNPLFRRPDGSTRIAGIWDQSIEGNGLSADSALDAIGYGTVYTREDINRALQSADPLSVVPSRDPEGHGTRLAAIAAGNSSSYPGFSGAAPEAELAIVRLKPAKQYLRDFYVIREDALAFQENDIMLGIKYLLLTARARQMPLVILLGLGTNTGSHSGTSPLGLYLTDLSRSSGQIIVAAAGNETGRGHHYRGSVPSDADYEDVELRVGPGETGFTMELWARESELYTVGFLSPSGEETGRLPVSGWEERRLSFLLEDTVIDLNYSSSEVATGSELIMMRFRAPAAGIWKIRVYHSLSIQGEYHIWLPVHGFLSEETFFLRPDPDTTITDPGNTAAIITTAAYNHRTGGIYLHSSRGFTRTGVIKPDLAAPGVDIPVPLNPTALRTLSSSSRSAYLRDAGPLSRQEDPETPARPSGAGGRLSPQENTDSPLSPQQTANSPLSLRQSTGAAYPLSLQEDSGTSLAAAFTAGAAAILLSWAASQEVPYYINTPIAKAILIRGASRRPNIAYPNREWGYGILDLYNAFLAIRE